MVVIAVINLFVDFVLLLLQTVNNELSESRTRTRKIFFYKKKKGVDGRRINVYGSIYS